jgi:hypothetical protein
VFNFQALELEAAKAAFEHLYVTVEDMMAEGNKVAVRFAALGIHKAYLWPRNPHDTTCFIFF